eukprot:3626652-Amphidinium_carterae.2
MVLHRSTAFHSSTCGGGSIQRGGEPLGRLCWCSHSWTGSCPVKVNNLGSELTSPVQVPFSLAFLSLPSFRM